MTRDLEAGTQLENRSIAVLRNRSFLLLWLSQAATQVGGNMVLYGLTVLIFSLTRSSSAVSLLLLTFLVPAVLFSAFAGVYVDRFDRRLMLVVTNVLRAVAFGVMVLVDDKIVAIYILNVTVSIITTFFGPAELAMIPHLVPSRQLLAANGIFTVTLNVAFALGFALLGPLVVTLAGVNGLILLVAALYLLAAGFCWTLPASPPTPGSHLSAGEAVAEAGASVTSVVSQLREGLAYIRAHRGVSWSLIYLGITASLIGVLGVLGPDFAATTLGLAPKDFVVVVLPLGVGVVTGILLLNNYGRYFPRRRAIEAGLMVIGVLLGLLSIAGPLARFLQRVNVNAPGLVELSTIISLLSVVIVIAFLTGVAYAVVAIPSQTQLQEAIPVDVRGRVFGVLNMLVSIASFLPIVIVGPISDAIGATAVIVAVGTLVALCGMLSAVTRDPSGVMDTGRAGPTREHPLPPHTEPIDPLAVALHHAEGTAGGPSHGRSPQTSVDGPLDRRVEPDGARRAGAGRKR